MMKLFPFLLLGLLVLPESIIHVPIFPFGKADAYPIRAPSNNDTITLSEAPVLLAKPIEVREAPVLLAKPIEVREAPVLLAKPIEVSEAPVLLAKPIEVSEAPVLLAKPIEVSEAPVVGGRNPQRNPHNSLECDACLLLANGLNQTVLHNPKVISIVTTDLEKICEVLPASVQQLCLGAAEQTAPLLLNHLGDLIATEGCSDLGICHSSMYHKLTA